MGRSILFFKKMYLRFTRISCKKMMHNYSTGFHGPIEGGPFKLKKKNCFLGENLVGHRLFS